MTVVPAASGGITTTWLSEALAPHYGPVAACSVEQIGVEFGFASEIARVVPVYEPPGIGPPSLVVKLAAGRSGREAEFYRQVGDYAGPRVPHCFYAAHDPQGDRSVLLLEDLGAARFGDAFTGCSLDDAALAVDALARLHSRWWQSPRLDDFGWPRFGETLDRRLAEHPGRLAACVARYDDLPELVVDVAGRIGPRHAALFARLAGPPETMIHVDSHLDNVAFLEGEAVLFDWQGVARGLAAWDLAHFLSSALRDAERDAGPDLVVRYHGGLVAGGVEGYPVDRLDEDYRVASLRLLMGVIGGAGSPAAAGWSGRQADLARDALVRWAAIVADLDLGGLV